MRQSLLKNLVHLVFSTKHRQAWRSEEIREALEDQPRHHRRMTFDDELCGLLTQHGMAFGERYVWD